VCGLKQKEDLMMMMMTMMMDSQEFGVNLFEVQNVF
jgi:hypothetical protein